MLLLLGCVPRTTTIQFVNDELDRIAITHNQRFRPTYVECQDALNKLWVRVVEVPPEENMLDIKVLQAKGKLKSCSRELEDAYLSLGPRVRNFKKAVDSLQ